MLSIRQTLWAIGVITYVNRARAVSVSSRAGTSLRPCRNADKSKERVGGVLRKIPDCAGRRALFLRYLTIFYVECKLVAGTFDLKRT